jgi:adenosylhomocysteine nucleosidase
MSGGEARPVALVTAIPEELDAILSRAREVRRDPYRFFQGRLSGIAVVLAATGDGARRSGRGAAALCDVHRPRALIGMGVAGALTDDLSALDIVVARRVCDAAADAPPPDARLLARALAMPGAREATFVTARGPVVTRGARAALSAAAGDAGTAVVDMESAAWAREAASRGIPYAILRAVSDGPEDKLPAYLAECLDEEGSVRRPRVVLRALARPFSIPVLLAMRGRVLEASARLATFVEQFLGADL